MATTSDTTASRISATPISPTARPWLVLSLIAAALAVAGNVVALSVDRIYENLTSVFLPQALAQDIVDLALVAPLIVVTAVLALRGSLRAWLVWLGALTFTVYNYVIYVVAIDFGPLFLLWVAVLGVALFCLVGGVGAADYAAVKARFADPRAVRVTGWMLSSWPASSPGVAQRGRAGDALGRDAQERRRHGRAHQPGARPRPGLLPAGDGLVGVWLLRSARSPTRRRRRCSSSSYSRGCRSSSRRWSRWSKVTPRRGASWRRSARSRWC